MYIRPLYTFWSITMGHSICTKFSKSLTTHYLSYNAALMIKMAYSSNFRNFLGERRVDWENNFPLNDVITQIQADGYLSTYQYEELISISNYNERRRKFLTLFLEKDEPALTYLFNLVSGLRGYSHLLPSVQPDCEISKSSTSE